MIDRLLLCTDLDGTLIPDARAPESPAARERFSRLAEREEVSLVFVTGRQRELVEEAIEEYELPEPDIVIADVGSTIYEVGSAGWRSATWWTSRLATDWPTGTPGRLRRLLADEAGLRLQPEARQSRHKLSYFVDSPGDPPDSLERVRRRLDRHDIEARVVFSRDAAEIGLIDLLPPGAGKLAAIQAVAERVGASPSATVFAGDSGNDMEALVGPLPAVLVANASAAVRREAVATSRENGRSHLLYPARGGLMKMNGNYAGGILEGVAHYHPELVSWMELA